MISFQNKSQRRRLKGKKKRITQFGVGGGGNKQEISSGLTDSTIPVKGQVVSISCAFQFGVPCVFYQITSVSEKIFSCNPFIEVRHSHVGKDLRPIQPWMMNVVSTVKQNGNVCAKCRLKFYKIRNLFI
jgi:hypothetical protein